MKKTRSSKEPASAAPMEQSFAWRKSLSDELVAVPADSEEWFLISPEQEILEKLRPANRDAAHLPPGDASTDAFTGAGIFLAGLSHLTKGYFVERSPLHFHLVLFVFEGELLLQLGDRQQTLRPPGFFVAPVGSTLKYTVPAKADIGWFHLDDMELWAALKGKGVTLLGCEALEELRFTMRCYIAEMQSTHHDKTLFLREYARLILLHLFRELKTHANPAEERVLQNLESVWDKVGGNLAKTWDVRDLAQEAGYSVGHFSRLCHRFYGGSPYSVLKEMRLTRAAQLITATDAKLRDIAEQVGYGDESALSKAFKRFHGTSPQAFRYRGSEGVE